MQSRAHIRYRLPHVVPIPGVICCRTGFQFRKDKTGRADDSAVISLFRFDHNFIEVNCWEVETERRPRTSGIHTIRNDSQCASIFPIRGCGRRIFSRDCCSRILEEHIVEDSMDHSGRVDIPVQDILRCALVFGRCILLSKWNCGWHLAIERIEDAETNVDRRRERKGAGT